MKRLIAAALVCGAMAVPGARAQDLPLPNLFGGPFELIDHNGHQVSDRSWRGRMMLIYFGYTHCPDVCPLNLATMGEALKQLGERADRIQPLFVTVDPARDDIGTLRDYATYFHPRMIGLTGTEQQVAAISKAYRLHRRKVVIDGDQQNYLVDHGSITYLMDEQGRFLTLFPHDTRVGKMIEVLSKYLAEQIEPGKS